MPAYRLQTAFQSLTEQERAQILELREHERKGFEDPVYFAEWHLGLTLHEGQKAWLRKSDCIWNKKTTRKNLLTPSNRWGKTVALAIKHIRFCYYKIGLEGELHILRHARYYTLDISPHSAQIDSCYNYIIDILHSRFPAYQKNPDGTLAVDKPKITNECRIPNFFEGQNQTKHQIQFSNFSNFFGASTGEDMGASLAGKTYGYLSYDECVLSHHLQDELFGRIFSRSFDLNAPIDLVSTFDMEGKSQQFLFHLLRGAMKGENEWSYHMGVMDENIFIPAKSREEKKESLRKENYSMYRQVVLGEAVTSSIKCFTPEVIEQIWERELARPSKNQIPLPATGGAYLISVDWGFAEQGDPTVMMVLKIDCYPYRIVHHEKLQGVSPTTAFATLQVLQRNFNDALVIMDTNALGGQVIKKLLRDMGVKTYDFDAHGGDKGEAIIQTQLVLMDSRKSRIVDDKVIEDNPNYGGVRSYYIKELEEELSDYEIDDKHLTQDFVVALYQALWWLRKKYRSPEPKTFYLSNTGGKIENART
jgi:hypothetical protein